ncbi:MAG: tyrosine-type recombinase/integrase [Solirubrobacteraceae bacterium]
MPYYPGRRAGTWRVTVWSGGRQHEEIVQGKEADARDHEAKMRLGLRAARSPAQRRTEPAFSVFCTEDYQPHALVHLGPKTWPSRACVIATLAAFFERQRPSQITAPLVTEYITERLRTVRPSTVNHELRVLSAMLRFAREDCGYPVAHLRIRMLRQTERRVHVWSQLEQARLLKVCKAIDPQFAPMLAFMLQTGVRRDEVIRAPWSWVTKRGGEPLLLVGQVDDWAPKSKRPREIPITTELARMLARLPRRGRWIFTRQDGERFSYFPYDRFDAVVSAAKLTGTPHTCRHSFASKFLDTDGSLFDLAAILGHSATRTTEIYAHLLPGHLQRARRVMNSAG